MFPIIILIFTFASKIRIINGIIEFDIPEEFYPPTFLMTIRNGIVPFYAQIVDRQKYGRWIHRNLEHEEDENEKPLSSFSSADDYADWIQEEAFYPKMDSILDQKTICPAANILEDIVLNGIGNNISIFCLKRNYSSQIAESIEGGNRTCRSQIDGCCRQFRNILIECVENQAAEQFSQNWNRVNRIEDCENVTMESIKVRFIKKLPPNLTRFQLKKGRFYCPSEITCFGEILIDPAALFDIPPKSQAEIFIKIFLNVIFFLFVVFLTNEM